MLFEHLPGVRSSSLPCDERRHSDQGARRRREANLPKITFVTHDGTEHVVDVAPGLSVMEPAVKNNVPGIDADCGGACACATCHVYVDAGWGERAGGKSEVEASMLDFAENVEANSRLACQIKVRGDLDGLVVRTPESQH
jgi:ferredoxin, 2Fe-2S